jgi:hypothetical protein
MDWFLRVILVAVAVYLLYRYSRGPRPEPAVDAVDAQARRNISYLEDEVYGLRSTVDELRRRIDDLEGRSPWDAEPPPDP